MAIEAAMSSWFHCGDRERRGPSASSASRLVRVCSVVILLCVLEGRSRRCCLIHYTSFL